MSNELTFTVEITENHIQEVIALAPQASTYACGACAALATEYIKTEIGQPGQAYAEEYRTTGRWYKAPKASRPFRILFRGKSQPQTRNDALKAMRKYWGWLYHHGRGALMSDLAWAGGVGVKNFVPPADPGVLRVGKHRRQPRYGVYRSSAPGQAPAYVTGTLYRSISYKAGTESADVIAGAPYASFLEYGTRFMAARPFFHKNIERAMAKFPEYFALWFSKGLP